MRVRLSATSFFKQYCGVGCWFLVSVFVGFSFYVEVVAYLLGRILSVFGVHIWRPKCVCHVLYVAYVG